MDSISCLQSALLIGFSSDLFFFYRFLCSSPSARLRAWSTSRVALYAIAWTSALVGLAYVYVPLQFETKQTLPRCPGNQGYSVFNGVWNLLIFSLGPSLIMLIFGSLTVRHVQQSMKRITPQNIDMQLQSV